MAKRPGSYIRARYRVTAQVGMRITWEGHRATITGFRDESLLIRIDGQDEIRAVHPKLGITYPGKGRAPAPLPGIPVTSRPAPPTGGGRVLARREVADRWTAGDTVPEIAAATGHTEPLTRQLLVEARIGYPDRNQS